MNPINSQNNNSLKLGFTMVESLVAITILLIAVVSPLTIVASSVYQAQVAKDQITAFYLSNEVFEYVRNMHDTGVLLGDTADGWLTDLNAGNLDRCKSTGGNVCELDVLGRRNPIVQNISSSGVVGMCLSDNGYTYCDLGWSGKQTNFKRYFTVDKIDATFNGGTVAEYKVTVTVSWNTQSLPRSITSTEYLMDSNY